MSTSATISVGGAGGTDTAWANTTVTFQAVTTNPTKGTASTDKIYWRRSGDSMEIRVDYRASGAGSNGSGDYLILIPDGKTIDTTKITVYTSTEVGTGTIGFGCIAQPGSYNVPAFVSAYDTTRVRFGSFQYGYVSNVISQMNVANIRYMLVFTVPIVEWA